jgi:hypothetical protein
MDSDTIIGIVRAVLLAAILLFIYLAYRHRRQRAKRVKMMDLLRRYFDGDVPAAQLGPRARGIANRHFMQSQEFYSLAIAAFQGAADARLTPERHSNEDEKELLGRLAALKNEFGLTDRYQIEGWRAGRE